MKKLLALLTALLLMALPLHSLAETCYETMLSLLATDEFLGTDALVYSLDRELTACQVLINTADGTVSLIGLDSEAKAAMVTWYNVTNADAMRTFYTFCVSFETLDGLCDEGFDFGLYWQKDEESGIIGVADAETAAAMADYFKTKLTELSGTSI